MAYPRTRVNPLSPAGRLMRAPREIGRFIENNARIAHFADRIAKGDGMLDASLSVKKHLFNYNELTPFERKVMVRVIPFYRFISNNLPLQLQFAAKQPGKFGAMIRALKAAGFDESGGDLGLPMQDLEAIPIPGMDALGTMRKEMLGRLNPRLKGPLEASGWRDRWRGSKY